jgi:excinuclease ABC subunit C
MIVAGPDGFQKSQYRKFNIRSAALTPGDDYGMLREVFFRRFKRLLSEAPRAGRGVSGGEAFSPGGDADVPPTPTLPRKGGGNIEERTERGVSGGEASSAAEESNIPPAPTLPHKGGGNTTDDFRQPPPQKGEVGEQSLAGRGSDASCDPSPDNLRWSDPPLSGEGEAKCDSPSHKGGGSEENGEGSEEKRGGSGGNELQGAESEDDDARESPWPDLVLIDGGGGQLAAACAILAELGITDLPLVGIAKGPDRDAGRETFFMPGREPFRLPPRDPVLYFVERLRDEAHRFAVGSHRQRRKRDIREAGLQEIPGVGPARKRALLRHFGTLKAIERASVSDLAQVAGVSSETARRIYDFFHESPR